jgi:hypothetical protein
VIRGTLVAVGATMNLTEHFTLEELVFSYTAVRLNIYNTPSSKVVDHLGVLSRGLEEVRKILNAPMRIDSGYRSPKLNEVVGGVPNSAHISGYAADFICPQFGTPLEIVKRVVAESGFDFDQIIQEGTWVHLSFAPAMRRDILTAHFSGGKGATYSMGVHE